MIGLLLNDFPANGHYSDSYTAGNGAGGSQDGLQGKRGISFTQIGQSISRLRNFTRSFRTLTHALNQELDHLKDGIKVAPAALKKLIGKFREALDECRKSMLRHVDRVKPPMLLLNQIRMRTPSISQLLSRHGQSGKTSG